MRDALDFSFQAPSVDEVAARGLDLLSYLGVSRPSQGYLDRCAQLGVAFTFIYESDPNRAQEGWNAGLLDAQFSDRRADERDYPADAAIAVVVSDGSSSVPSSGGERIADYAEAWARQCRRPLFFYGNRYAIDHALFGARRFEGARILAGPNGDGGWIPVSWGGDHNRDPIIQEANTAPPIGGTDLNSVWFPYHSLGAPALPDLSFLEGDDMDILVGVNKFGDVQSWLVVGNAMAHLFAGPVNQFGIAAEAVAFNTANPHVKITGVPAGVLDDLYTITQNALHPPAGSGSGVDAAAIDAAVRRQLDQTRLAPR